MLSLILPTYNEAANIKSLIESIDGVLQSVPHEIIIVDDDSPDMTWKAATELSEKFSTVRVIRRTGKRGLSSAVVEGFEAARGDKLAVMDADGQHDAELLTRMLKELETKDLVTGSRYVSGGSVGQWVGDRRFISRAGTLLARNLSRLPVTDPLSGFFMLRADLYRRVKDSLKPTGFKILLEILSHVPEGTRIAEVPLIFRMRLHGQSKLSFSVNLQFAGQVLRLFLKRLLFLGPYLFAIISIVTALIFIPRTVALKDIYFKTDVRSAVQNALVTAAKRQGWLLSDIELKSVSKEEVVLIHRDHLRVQAPGIVCVLSLKNNLLKCEEF